LKESKMVNSMSDYQNFLFYGSIRESVEELPEDLGNKLLRAVMIYGTEGVIHEDDPTIKAVLRSIAPNIERCHKRWEDRLAYQKNKKVVAEKVPKNGDVNPHNVGVYNNAYESSPNTTKRGE
jgi:hypothetical protein